mmetsp:Transcript_8696/g.25038  ORF Transcript_8696/g.25038 Transcript_8696/m.25038 type:complete len:317 (-) Transcript_8696:278-1228(-)
MSASRSCWLRSRSWQTGRGGCGWRKASCRRNCGMWQRTGTRPSHRSIQPTRGSRTSAQNWQRRSGASRPWRRRRSPGSGRRRWSASGACGPWTGRSGHWRRRRPRCGRSGRRFGTGRSKLPARARGSRSSSCGVRRTYARLRPGWPPRGWRCRRSASPCGVPTTRRPGRRPLPVQPRLRWRLSRSTASRSKRAARGCRPSAPRFGAAHPRQAASPLPRKALTMVGALAEALPHEVPMSAGVRRRCRCAHMKRCPPASAAAWRRWRTRRRRPATNLAGFSCCWQSRRSSSREAGAQGMVALPPVEAARDWAAGSLRP